MQTDFVNRYLMVLMASTFLITLTPHDSYPLPTRYQPIVEVGKILANGCLNGRKTIPEKLEFRIVPGPYFYLFFSPALAGLTFGHTIYVAEGERRNPEVFAHEMIHASGVHGHPDEYFKDCGL